MLTALQDLGLERLWVVYPGDQEYAIDDRISVVPISGLTNLKERIDTKDGRS